MNPFALATLIAALTACLLLGDRLRRINWHTTKPVYMLLYLSHVLWALGIVYSVITNGAAWPHLAGLSAMFCWLAVTCDHWVDGVPEEIVKPKDLVGPQPNGPWVRFLPGVTERRAPGAPDRRTPGARGIDRAAACRRARP